MHLLETPRLFLREFTGNDFAPFAQINACAHVCEFLPRPLTREESNAFARRIMDHMQKHGFCLYAVEEKSSGEFIGYTGLNIPNFDAPFLPAVEIGWRLKFSKWNNGYATEAAHAVLEYGFETLKLPEIISFTAEINKRSRRIMEKLGMTHNHAEDFPHPALNQTDRLSRHVLYRKSAPNR